MSDWQPISTAPKGEAVFLAYCPADDAAGERMMIWNGKIFHDQSTMLPKHLKFPATHWMSLPAPPEKA